MKRRNVLLVFAREVRDQFRDRRTMFMMLVLPLLLYPGMGVGMLEMTTLFSEQSRTVVVLGNDQLPESPPLIVDGEFDKRLFAERPEYTNYLKLILETAPEPPHADSEKGSSSSATTDPEASDHQKLFEEARAIVALTQRKQKLLTEFKSRQEAEKENSAAAEKDTGASSAGKAASPEKPPELVDVEEELADRFLRFDADLIVAFPEQFGDFVGQYVSEDRPSDPANPEFSRRPIVVYNSASEQSQITYGRVLMALRFWERELQQRRQENLHLPSTFISPVFEQSVEDGERTNVADVAQEEQHSANIWSRFFPTLLILMTLTGAFYPSVDLGAGEKERGTMETLLISPAARSEIVLGKFLTILLFSILTAMVNIASMGGSLFLFSLAGHSSASPLAGVSLPSIGTLLMLAVMMVPLASLFSALSLSLATFARSTKEGQYYLTPMMLVVMGLTIFCMSPAVELTPFNSMIPVVGMGLLLKNLLQSSLSSVDVLAYVVPVMVTSLGYSLLALWWANEQFHKEEVLFREAERFELGLWLKHMLREKEPLPTVGEAVFCFVLIMLLQFPMASAFRSILDVPPDQLGLATQKVLVIQQLALIASPALFMGLLLTSQPLKTFRLRIPSVKWIAAGIVLPFLVQPPVVKLMSSLDWFFPHLPASVVKTVSMMGDASFPLWQVLLVFALAPAICEELAFRGLILSGFSRNGRTGVAIVFSALLFGMFHMIPQQIFNGFLQGMIIGLLAIRSGSLIPGVIYHFINNGLQVGLSRLTPELITQYRLDAWIEIGDTGSEFTWLTIAFGGICGSVLLGWLYRSSNEVDPSHPDLPEFLHRPSQAT